MATGLILLTHSGWSMDMPPMSGMSDMSSPAVRMAVAPITKPQPDSTRRMAERLAELDRESDAAANPFLSEGKIPVARAAIEQTSDPHQLVVLKSQLVQYLLQAGHTQEALAASDAIFDFIHQRGIGVSQRTYDDLLVQNAVCHLRVGEEDNCLANHNPDSCLFPIERDGIHKIRRGSQGAIGVLTECLKHFPGDLRARWLLNIAYMTLGEYPDQVPAAWRIDPKAFASGYDLKRFPDVAPAVGLDTDSYAGGVVLDDFDNDGLLDLAISNWNPKGQLQLFRNNGDGTFTDWTAAAGLTGETGGLNLIQCDYNNDGFIDLLVLRGGWMHGQGKLPMSLLRNNGDFTFTDVTEEAHLLRFHPTQAAVWFDFNGDGWLDLFVANESDGENLNPCELYRNNGDGTFTECAAECGVNVAGYFKGVVSADFNGDGRPDLFLSSLGGKKYLFRNDGPADPHGPAAGPWKFTNVADEAGIDGPEQGFSCWFFDYDNDGWPDLYVSGFQVQDVGDVAADYLGVPTSGERSHLYHNNGDGTFTDVSHAMGIDIVTLTMGCNFGDLDNDGWLDFYLGTGDPYLGTLIPNRMFRNDAGKRFQDVTTAGGFGQLQKGHGIAFGDINNDGSQDIYSVVGGWVEADHAHRQLFANPGNTNHWLKLKLIGVKTNRAAYGARIKIVLQTDEGERDIYRTVGSGGSFGGSPLRQEIGLGQANAITRVEIFWPVTGITQTITGLALDRAYSIREGDKVAQPLVLRRFDWPTATDGSPHIKLNVRQ